MMNIIKKFETHREYMYTLGGRSDDEIVNFHAYSDGMFNFITINIQDGSELELIAVDPDELRAMRKSGEVRRATEEESEEWLNPRNEVRLTIEESRFLRDFLNDPKTIQLLGL